MFIKLKLKLTQPVVFFDRPGHFSFNVKTLFRMSLLFPSYLGYDLPLSFAGQFRLLPCYHLGGYEFGLEIESVLGKFEKTIYNDISSTG